MEFLFAYIAGLLALINPCVLPILPVVIAGSLSSSKYGPIALLSGLCLSFTLVGIVIAALGPTLGIDEETVSRTAAAIMVGLGLFLLLSTNSATSSMFDGTANVANNLLAKVPTTGLRNQFVGGVLLGAAWAPCIGN